MKQLVPAKLEDYAAAHSAPESPECRAIREETYRTRDCPQMVVGPLEAAFLKVMVKSVGARNVLEVGTFTGYSALAMAEALPEDGKLLTCEIDAESALCRGRTVVDVWGRSGREPNAHVSVDIDADGFLDLLVNRLNSLG